MARSNVSFYQIICPPSPVKLLQIGLTKRVQVLAFEPREAAKKVLFLVVRPLRGGRVLKAGPLRKKHF